MLRAIKIVVSVGLISYLLYAIDLRSTMAELRNAAVIPLLLAFPTLVVTVLVSAWKWRIALSIHCLEWRIGQLFRILFIAVFLNNFLPTAVGGDIYRAYRTLPAGGMKSSAVSALLLDRIVGLLALLFVGAVGAAVIYVRDDAKPMGWLACVFGLPLLFAVTIPVLARSPTLRSLSKRLGRWRNLEPVVHNANLILGRTRELAQLVAVSLLFQALAVYAIVLLFAALRTTGIVAESAVVAAMYAIASLLPISINGWGVMESSFALTAARLGINFESAVVVTLTLRLTTVLLSLVGAVLFLQDKGRGADVDAISLAKTGQNAGAVVSGEG